MALDDVEDGAVRHADLLRDRARRVAGFVRGDDCRVIRTLGFYGRVA